MERITFAASLPPIQSAISLDGYGDGGRVKLDVPARDVSALLLLQHHGAGQQLRVTIEIEREADERRTGSGRVRTAVD